MSWANWLRKRFKSSERTLLVVRAGRLAASFCVLSILILPSILAVTASQSAGLRSAPRIGEKNQSYSLNWSGYYVSAGSFNTASGSWTVPAVKCSSGTQYSSFWVGIDGAKSNTVEQTGTDSDCRSGSAVYYAWYEFYPAYPVNLDSSSYPVRVGDVMSATVTYSSGQFTATLADNTKGWTFTSPATSVSGAAQSSAECIAERPSIAGSLTKLANFGVVSFTGCSANGTAFNSSTAQEIIMVSFSGRILAQPSGITSGSFTVTWYRSS